MPGQQSVEGKNVLIVDDEQDVRDLLNMALESLGCEIRTACDGQDALAQIARKRPDLILLDLKMPNLNGYHLFARLKSDELLSKIPVIIITGLSQDSEHDDDEWARRMGAEAFLTKPFELKELRERVKELAGKFL